MGKRRCPKAEIVARRPGVAGEADSELGRAIW